MSNSAQWVQMHEINFLQLIFRQRTAAAHKHVENVAHTESGRAVYRTVTVTDHRAISYTSQLQHVLVCESARRTPCFSLRRFRHSKLLPGANCFALMKRSSFRRNGATAILNRALVTLQTSLANFSQPCLPSSCSHLFTFNR